MTFNTRLAPTNSTNPAATAVARNFELAAQLDPTVHVLSSANNHETSSADAGGSLRVHEQVAEHATAFGGESE